ncbi:PspA/IM30 family protein [Pseudanabaenaceae cyanobacterium LEGE 13415]|nr:PspA/IM30 family protein [Pseudanabaenaceae cyanobacterium LEGE 13415]
MQSAQDKLDRGLDQLAKAGNDPDALGLALQSIHGALEDYFRNVLTGNRAIATEQQNRIRDRGEVKWKELLDLMQEYEGLGKHDRDLIVRMNSLRNAIAHGEQFTGTRTQVENYAKFVERYFKSATSSNKSETSSHSTASSHSTTSSRWNQPITPFTIPANLIQFTWQPVPILLKVSATLDCVTGRVIRIKEKTITTTNNNVRTNHLQQVIWFTRQDGSEDYAELYNFGTQGIQAREGYTVTFLSGNRNSNRQCVAVYVHELNRYFYNRNPWKKLLFGLYLLPGIIVLGVVYYTLSPLLWLIPIAIFGNNVPLFLLTVLVSFIAPIAFCIAFGWMICKKFEVHIGRVFVNPTLQSKKVEHLEQLYELRRQVAEEIATKHRLVEQYEAAKGNALDWQKRVELATEKGDPDLRNEALGHQKRFEEQADQLKIKLDVCNQKLEQLKRSLLKAEQND